MVRNLVLTNMRTDETDTNGVIKMSSIKCCLKNLLPDLAIVLGKSELVPEEGSSPSCGAAPVQPYGGEFLPPEATPYVSCPFRQSLLFCP